jgi:hypothetical protein
MPKFPTKCTNRRIKVQVSREVWWAVALHAEREGKSMSDVLLECAWSRLRRLKPPKGMFKTEALSG